KRPDAAPQGVEEVMRVRGDELVLERRPMGRCACPTAVGPRARVRPGVRIPRALAAQPQNLSDTAGIEFPASYNHTGTTHLRLRYVRKSSRRSVAYQMVSIVDTIMRVISVTVKVIAEVFFAPRPALENLLCLPWST